MSNCTTNKVGIFGGTFNPVHFGHLIIAEFAKCEFDLDKVIFVPAKEPPHKGNEELIEAEHRFNMTSLAVASNPAFEVSREELDRPGPSYSVDTLANFQRKMANAHIYFIIGADAILEILTWKDARKVMELCHFLAATRPGFAFERLQEQIQRLPSSFSRKIIPFEIPAIDISSTYIRKRISNKASIKYLVPDSVEKYLRDHNLYLRNLPKEF